MKTSYQLLIMLTAGVLAGLLLVGCESSTTGGGFYPEQNPLLDVSADSLDFGWNGRQRTILISNIGGDTLIWKFSAYPVWIAPSCDSGNVVPVLPQEITFDLERAELNIGVNEGNILLTSNAGDWTIVVRADQADSAVLGELPDTIEFAYGETSVDLTIFNAGADTLSWSAGVGNPLFILSQTAGVTAQEADIEIDFDWDNAPPQWVCDTLWITSNGGNADVILSANNLTPQGMWLSSSPTPDGYYVPQPLDYYFINRFDRPDGWDAFRIDSIAVMTYTFTNAYDDIKFSSWGMFIDEWGILWPDLYDILYVTPLLDPVNGWSVWSVNWTLNRDQFAVGYYQYNHVPTIFPDPYYDATPPVGDSYLGWEETPGWIRMEWIASWDWCLEVYVSPLETTDGGVSAGRWLQPEPAGVPGSSPRFAKEIVAGELSGNRTTVQESAGHRRIR